LKPERATIGSFEQRAREVRERRQRRVLSMARIGFWEVNFRTNAHRWSDELFDIYGRPKETTQPSYEEFLGYVHPEDRALFERAEQEMQATRQPMAFDFRIVRPDGAVRWIHNSLELELDEAGNPVALFGINQDITERKALEAALADSESRFRNFLDNSPSVAFMKDVEGRYVFINRAGEQRFGVPRSQWLGTTDWERFPAAIAMRMRATDARVRASGAPVQSVEQTPTPDGRVAHWIVHKFPIVSPRGDLLVGGTATDITERVLAKQQLSARIEQLAQTNEELQRYAHVASHDLQEPLRTIASYTQLLERRFGEVADPRGREYVNFVTDAVRRMQTLIEQLLTHANATDAASLFVPVDLGAVLERCRGDLAKALDDARAILTHDPLPCVTGDPVGLYRVFQNLLTNAVKYRGPAPLRIHVGARPAATGWEFTVGDNGIGIEPAHLESIFALFERRHRVQPGSGIGLAVCKKIVEHHGGRVWARSSGAGAGTTIHFTLPGPGPEPPAASAA
jgi:PAS domain S-box-containing protein